MKELNKIEKILSKGETLYVGKQCKEDYILNAYSSDGECITGKIRTSYTNRSVKEIRKFKTFVLCEPIKDFIENEISVLIIEKGYEIRYFNKFAPKMILADEELSARKLKLVKRKRKKLEKMREKNEVQESVYKYPKKKKKASE